MRTGRALLALVVGAGLAACSSGRRSGTPAPTTAAVPAAVSTTVSTTPAAAGFPVEAPAEVLIDAHPVGPRSGWVLTDGRLLRSDDAGQHWQSLALPIPTPAPESGPRPAASFLDPVHAWVATSTGGLLTVARSDATDRLTVSPPLKRYDTNPSAVVQFIDRTHGFVAARATGRQGDLFSTGDGGVTWSLVNASAPADELKFVTPTEGWASGAGLFHTLDGGRTWTRLHPPGWNDDGGPLPGGPAYGLVRASRTQLLIESYVPTGMLAGVSFLLSSDSGRTWRTVGPPQLARTFSGTGPQPTLTALDFMHYRLFMGAQERNTVEMFTSEDAGRTWHTRPTPLHATQPDPHFWSSAVGWTPLGESRSVWATIDAGATWNPLPIPFRQASPVPPRPFLRRLAS